MSIEQKAIRRSASTHVLPLHTRGSCKPETLRIKCVNVRAKINIHCQKKRQSISPNRQNIYNQVRARLRAATLHNRILSSVRILARGQLNRTSLKKRKNLAANSSLRGKKASDLDIRRTSIPRNELYSRIKFCLKFFYI